MVVAWDGDNCKCSECTSVSIDGRSSVDILIGWITHRNRAGEFFNWMRYKGATKTKTGANKRTIANEISTLLRKHGLQRDGAAVIDKIARIVASFNRAKDWERNTGRSLLASTSDSFACDENNYDHHEIQAQNEKTIEEAKLNFCKYYNELSIVFNDKPLSTPVYHSSTGDVIDFPANALLETNTNELQDDINYEADGHGSPPRRVHEASENKPPQKKLKLSSDSRQKSFGETIASALEGQGK
ncbi:hypothetical protein AC1031_004644, partial [Aphanomyces cochlioides]